jgi:hypothetical protein
MALGRYQGAAAMLRAWTKAHRLLARNIRPTALASLRRKGVLRVRGGTSGAIYEISHSESVCIPGVCRLCVMVAANVPTADVLLALALYIEHDEPRFLRTANCIQVMAPEQLARIRRKCGVNDYWEYRYLFGEVQARHERRARSWNP